MIECVMLLPGQEAATLNTPLLKMLIMVGRSRRDAPARAADAPGPMISMLMMEPDTILAL